MSLALTENPVLQPINTVAHFSYSRAKIGDTKVSVTTTHRQTKKIQPQSLFSTSHNSNNGKKMASKFKTKLSEDYQFI